MYYCYLDTPIGDLLLAGDEDALSLVGFPEGSMRREPQSAWIFSELTIFLRYCITSFSSILLNLNTAVLDCMGSMILFE